MKQARLLEQKRFSGRGFSIGDRIQEYLDLAKNELPNAIDKLKKILP